MFNVYIFVLIKRKCSKNVYHACEQPWICIYSSSLMYLLFLYSCFQQDELDDTVQVWKTHTIRPSKNLNVPSGRPNVMFALPELYGTRDFLSPIEDYDFQLQKWMYLSPDQTVWSRSIWTMQHLYGWFQSHSSNRSISGSEFVHAPQRGHQGMCVGQTYLVVSCVELRSGWIFWSLK